MGLTKLVLRFAAPVPKVEAFERYLFVGPHPDDIEINCAGTLAKYAAQGHKVFTATATNGNVGSATLPMDEIARIRKEEARKAAAVIGAEYICLGIIF